MFVLLHLLILLEKEEFSVNYIMLPFGTNLNNWAVYLKAPESTPYKKNGFIS